MPLSQSRLWRRSTLAIAAVFLVSAILSWWWLPPAPRFTIGSRAHVRLLDVSPDGTLLAIASGKQIELWSLETSERRAVLPIADLDYVRHALFTADSQRLVANCFLLGRTSGVDDQWARIYRVDSEEVETVLPLKNHFDLATANLRDSHPEPLSFCLSPNGKRFACLAPQEGSQDIFDGVLKLWDLVDSREVALLDDSINAPLHTPLAFSPDGRYLAAGISQETRGGTSHIKIWEAATGRAAHELPVPAMPLRYSRGKTLFLPCKAVTFSSDGHGVIGLVCPSIAGMNDQLFYWDLATGELQHSLAWHGQETPATVGGSAVLRSARGKQVVVQGLDSFLPIAHLCDLAGPEPRVQESFLGNPPVLSNDGNRLAIGSQRSGIGALLSLAVPSELKLMDLATMQTRSLSRTTWFKSHDTPLAFAPGDEALVVSSRFWFPSLYVYDVATGWRKARLPGSAVRFTRSGTSLIAIDDRSVGELPGVIPDPLGGGVIRVYDYPFRPRVLAILIWTMLPTAIAIALIRRRRAWRSRRRSTDSANEMPQKT